MTAQRRTTAMYITNPASPVEGRPSPLQTSSCRRNRTHAHQQHPPAGSRDLILHRRVVGLLFVCLGLPLTITSPLSATTVISTSTILEDTLWQRAAGPYLITGDVTVRHPYSSSTPVTLTIEAGTEIQFTKGMGLFIGTTSRKGALVAVGTPAAPIRFTSAEPIKQPGDWKGVYFNSVTDDTTTQLEHCVIEYGGATYNANLSFLCCLANNPEYPSSIQQRAWHRVNVVLSKA